jgi:serine phosphatase RsbU (regulator of sigma subunit)
VLRALSVPLGVLLLMVPLLVATSWYAHATLERGAAVQELFRDVQYGRARLGLVQVNQETGVRGYVLTGDPRFLEPYRQTKGSFDAVVTTLRDDLKQLNLPAADLDAMQRLHAEWAATVAAPLIANPHGVDERTLEYRGEALLERFRAHETAFRRAATAAAARADERLQHMIDLTLIAGALANVAVLLVGLTWAVVAARSAQRLLRVNVLYENEKRIADSLQEAFLQKRLPAVSGLVLDGSYVPAANRSRVGGDWYDAFELPDGRLLFSIGDVAGHGIEAALVMNRARQAIVVAALQETDPGAVLERANQTILLQEGVMVTAICGFIDPGNLEIVYASAGHPAPVVVRPDGDAAPLPHSGVPLGVFDDSRYRTFVAHASAGDLVVLYTDGLIEYERDVLAGEARLLEAVLGARSAVHPARALHDAVFGGAPPADDVAILTIAFQPAAKPAGVTPSRA